jgi:hypothetical protein
MLTTAPAYSTRGCSVKRANALSMSASRKRNKWTPAFSAELRNFLWLQPQISCKSLKESPVRKRLAGDRYGEQPGIGVRP